ncbi:mucin-2 isoform X1 [Diorhabda sublineata]|uniref:mucin-2 isoform X1 n=1 Tax=Diorhabda sublineata TaxID=1163346 RepID=UPI0024E18E12|nr:mucin-2 isoform X1 [Diorhabda sublineata]
MDSAMERETGALGGLFQQIIQDMKNGMPLWEDFVTKASKLHSSLKATILAVTAYLESFQRIADSATNTRGATREIGTALTRICLRHKAVENRLKKFTSVIMECLIVPLQEKLEEWKKIVVNLDKDHTRDFKRAKSELKKRSTDTLRLQKKLKKGVGGDVQKRFECGLQDVTERRQLLEETEKHAVRAALIEERTRFCSFVGLLKPVVEEEIAMLTEMGHLQEAVQQLEKHTYDPKSLPPASEQIIADLKSSESGWSFQTPPSSPSSLGSRKSSMCSISSINSSSSSSSKSHHSPSHPWQRSLSQPVGRSGTMRVRSVSSQDSGFMSQDTLFLRPPSAFSATQISNMSEHSNNSSSSSTPCTPFPVTAAPTTTATWPNLQETIQFERAASAIINDRPHTISSAYEKGHQRSPLTVYTFQAPDQTLSQPASPVTSTGPTDTTSNIVPPKSPGTAVKSSLSKPPLPLRCSSLERPSGPSIPAKTITQGVRVLPPGAELSVIKKPSPLPSHLSKINTQPTYANMHELAIMAAAAKNQDKGFPPPPPTEFTSPPEKAGECEKESSTSESSLESSSGYGSQTTFNFEEIHHVENMSNTGTLRNTLLRRGSIQSQKPPPPIRRTSSITNTSTIGSLENLPPPPPFLLEPSIQPPPKQQQQQQQPTTGINVAETVKALTELNHTPASPNSVRRMSTSSQNIFQTTSQTQFATPLLSTFQNQSKVSYLSQSGGVVYAQPLQITGSPTTMRRIQNLRSQSADRKSDGPGGVSSNFIASLSAKLTPHLSPKSSRRLSDDSTTPTNSPINKHAHHHKSGPGQSFLDSLNAKLSQTHTLSAQPTQLKANKIRQMINSRAQPDPKVCHESLMDQIKKGATLKRAKSTNDRSAPKIC